MLNTPNNGHLVVMDKAGCRPKVPINQSSTKLMTFVHSIITLAMTRYSHHLCGHIEQTADRHVNKS